MQQICSRDIAGSGPDNFCITVSRSYLHAYDVHWQTSRRDYNINRRIVMNINAKHAYSYHMYNRTEKSSTWD
jgi:hypothetical protein